MIDVACVPSAARAGGKPMKTTMLMLLVSMILAVSYGAKSDSASAS
jgi:hypothetical protein